MQLQRRAGLGIALALTGGLLISIDIPMIRLAQSDPWLFMVARGAGLAIVLGIFLRFGKQLTETPPNPFSDPDWVLVGILYGLSSIFFTLSVFNTSTANLVFILAFNPMLAACFSWWITGERPSPITWIAIALTFVGVAIIVGDGLKGGTWFGDLTSLITAIFLALSLTFARRSGKDMSLSGCLAGMISGLFALPLALIYSHMPGAPVWIILNALLLAPLAGFTLSLAPRFIPSPQVAMFFLLETVLAPVWVWLIFAEIPSDATMIGGTIVLIAIAGHSFFQIVQSRRLPAANAAE